MSNPMSNFTAIDTFKTVTSVQLCTPPAQVYRAAIQSWRNDQARAFMEYAKEQSK